MASIVVILVYSLKFDSWQEKHWYWACMIGFLMVALLLDIIRAAVITIVELRRFEIRKRSKAGDFVVRKVQKQDDKDGLPALLKPKPKVKPQKTSATPKVAPKFSNMERPKFLPDAADMSGVPMLGPPGTPGRGGGHTPTGGTPRGMTGKGSIMPPPSPPGARTPPGQRTPPKVPFGQASPMAKGDVSPTGSQASRISQSLSQSLADRRAKGNITPPGMKGGPPPPPGVGGKGAPRPPQPPGMPGSRTPPGSGSRTPPR